MCGGCTPTTEVCDGIDNDCDTLVDEELGNTTCGVGACTNTTDNCIGGIPQTCTPLQPTPEVCNNIDDDCDGQIDNFTQAASNIFGLCFNNTETCSLGVWYNSTSNYVPANESCDTFDNDCDNQTDERVCPRKMKNESIPLIQALNKTTSPVINSNLLSTILSINNSLAPNLWINDTHINRIRGGIVFDQEKKAVELMTAIKNDRQTPANVKGVCDVVIPTLVEADRLLAQAAIDYAKAAPPGNPTEIANADADMTMALTYLTAGKPNLAVLSYRQAWVHAINAKA